MLSWVQPEDLLVHALRQARLAGHDVGHLEGRWVAAGRPLDAPVSGVSAHPASPEQRDLARLLLDEIDVAFPETHHELADIRRGAPVPESTTRPEAGPDLLDRVLGAWLGRCAGCLLGKPVEKIPREGIEAILRSTGNWPLTTWFTGRDLDPQIAAAWPWNRRSAPTSLAETIDGMPEDDDLNFTVLALRMLETFGDALTTHDVAQSWLENLPAGRVFTAERVAYRNLLDGVDPLRAALVRNPFREWIGALIRVDVYGWTHPGDLEGATRLAHADARLTHTGDGVLGAVWAAALASAALVADDVEAALDHAQASLPAGSGLARAVRAGQEIGRSDSSFAEALDALHAVYGHLHWVHVLNNAATIAFALTRGRGDLGASIGLAVMAGWDTDSVGATVGGVVGAVAGAARLPAGWVTPLDNRLATSLPGPPVLALDELARRTVALIRRSA